MPDENTNQEAAAETTAAPAAETGSENQPAATGEQAGGENTPANSDGGSSPENAGGAAA